MDGPGVPNLGGDVLIATGGGSFEGKILGGGALTLIGPSGGVALKLMSTDTHNFTGPIVIHGQVEDLTADGVSSKSAISVDLDGTLSIKTQSTTFASLEDISGHSSGVITSGSTATALSIGDGTTTTFSGEIEGLISLVKQGTGALTFAGVDTYSGVTFVSAGSLVVDGSITSHTEVGTTGLLGGQGHVATVTVDAGGVLSPGGMAAGSGLVGHFTT